MKTTVYMNTTLNGLVARPDDTVDFIQDAQWPVYFDFTEYFEVMVVGRKTYAAMLEFGDYAKVRCRRLIVLSSQNELPMPSDREIEFWHSSPTALMQHLQRQKVPSVLISGGPHTNAAFFEAGLVDEVVMDISPQMIANGVPYLPTATGDVALDFQSVELTKLGTLLVKAKVAR